MSTGVSSGIPRGLYATGRIRALERYLIDGAGFGRLAENPSRRELLEDLSDTPYAPYVKENGLEEGFELFLHSVFEFLEKNIEVPEALFLFYIRTDITNFINRVRGENAPEKMREGVFTAREWGREKYPGFFRLVPERVLREYPSLDESPDAFLEKVSLDYAFREFYPPVSGTAVAEYFRDRTDIDNLLLNLLHEKPFYRAGGRITEKEWGRIDPKKSVPPKLGARGFMKAVEHEKDYGVWEDLLKGWLGSRLRDMRKVTFGIEPPLGYFLSITEEVRNLRAVLAGIDASESPDRIRERISAGYV